MVTRASNKGNGKNGEKLCRDKRRNTLIKGVRYDR